VAEAVILNLLQFVAMCILGFGLVAGVRTYLSDRRKAKDARYARCLVCLTQVGSDWHSIQDHSWRFHNGPKPDLAQVAD
jgi:hypothetical protein